MPIKKGKSKAVIAENISTEMKSGRPKGQSVAIALNEARKSGAKIPFPPAMKKGGKKK
jgi:hypothetical protein